MNSFCFAATDRTYQRPASGTPAPDEFPVLTRGVLAVRGEVLGFTVYSDAKDDAAVREALAALRGVTLAGPSSPGKQIQGIPHHPEVP